MLMNEDRDFVEQILTFNVLETAIQWIRENKYPEDIFDYDELEEWAEYNGFEKYE